MGYKTKCRFFRDSDQVDEITWYPALPDAPLLGVPTMFASLRHEPRDFFWLPGGEVPYEPFTVQRPVTKPGALGVHHCGSDDDFAEGCAFLPDDPPVLYQTNGLPDCCGASPAVRGGGAGGGKVGVVVTAPLVPNTCDTAYLMTPGVTYPFHVPDTGTFYFRVDVTVGQTAQWVLNVAGSTVQTVFAEGPCASATPRGGFNATVPGPWVTPIVSLTTGIMLNAILILNPFTTADCTLSVNVF